MYIVPRIRVIHLVPLKDYISQPPNTPELACLPYNGAHVCEHITHLLSVYLGYDGHIYRDLGK